METVDMVKAVVEPANKLIDAVSNAIGKAYEPRYIKKKADSKAYEINKIGEAMRNNMDLPINYETLSGISISTSDYEALAKRAGERLAHQEVIKQYNIEKIIDSAYESLQGKQAIEDGEISREWMHRFIESAGDVSTEELQKLWSKVLAGEVLYPKNVSLRTLECLKNLDVSDANLFEHLCKYVVANEYVINDTEMLRRLGEPYENILRLDECGLINSSGTISYNIEIQKAPESVIDFGKYVLFAETDNNVAIRINEFPLTSAGRELYKIVSCEMSLDMIKKMSGAVARMNEHVVFKLYKVNSREGTIVNYDTRPIDFVE